MAVLPRPATGDVRAAHRAVASTPDRSVILRLALRRHAAFSSAPTAHPERRRDDGRRARASGGFMPTSSDSRSARSGVVDARVTRPRRVSLQWPAPRDRDPRLPPSGCGASEESPRVLAVRRTGWWPQDRRVLAALAATRDEYRFIDDLLLSRRIRQNRSDPARRARIRTEQRSNELSELRVDDRQAVPALDVGHVRDAEQTAYLVLGNLQRPG